MTLTELISNFAFPLLITLVLLLAAAGLTAWAFASRRKPAANKNKPPAQPELQELVRLYRDPRTKTLALGSGDRLYRRRGELSVNQVDQLSILMGELLAWLGKPELARRAVQAQLDASASEDFDRSFPIPGYDQPGPTSRSNLMNPLDALVKGVGADVPRISSPPSLAAQVDEILQAKLAESSFRDRAVRLVELPGKGMVVLVGTQQYESIDQVPGPEVQALIRQSVIEWEGRSRG